jgi:hypothetical protein
MPDPGWSVQLAEEPKLPGPSDTNETMPDGCVGLEEVSTTVAVQLAEAPTCNVDGVHAAIVVVVDFASWFTVTVAVPVLLLWYASLA